MAGRDPAQYNEASFDPDPTEGLDTLSDHIRELAGKHVRSLPPAQMAGLCRIIESVVTDLLDEGRLGALVDVQRLTGRELLARLMAEVIDAPDAAVMARSIDFTFSLGVQMGASQTEIARMDDVTKASISRHCRALCETYLGGRPSVGMKSVEAVKSYRAVQIQRQRPAPPEWEFGHIFKPIATATHAA